RGGTGPGRRRRLRPDPTGPDRTPRPPPPTATMVDNAQALINIDEIQYPDEPGGPMTDFLTAAEAADRLGVKPATLYAYVSRGVLTRGRASDGRGSLFDAGEIEG